MEDNIRVYDKNQRRYTMKNGKIVRVQNIFFDELEDCDLNEIKDDLVADYENSNFCGNCNAEIRESDKYCPYCGTKKGEGEFLPFLNEILCVYGPAIKNYYKCKVCKHKWADYIKKNKYCPKCGSSNIILKHKLVGDSFFDEDIPMDNSYLSLIKFKITKNIIKLKRIFKFW